MAPDFKEAATELKGKAVLVDLDATIEKDLAAKYEIKGFPTLKLFSKGELISDYKGGRTKDELIKYIERALLPSVTDCADAEAVAKVVTDNKGKSIFFGVALEKLSSDYKKVSMAIRDMSPETVAFASVTDAALVKDHSADAKPDTILLIREDGTTTIYDKDGSDLEAWSKQASLPVFSELSRDTAAMYTELDTPIFILFQDPDKKDEAVNEVVTEIAKAQRSSGKIAFTWLNSVELKSFAEHVGVDGKSPAIAIYEFKTDMKYVFGEEYSADALKAWVGKFIAGEIVAHVKSESVPEKNDEPVKIVVGESWKDIVEDGEKDVLIEQYAPWCGHCKKLAPILDELAADLKDIPTVVIAKMDATKNDAPKDFKAQGYPTLHFFAAGKPGVAYDGGRTKEDFIKYFKENATHNDDIEVPEKAEEEAKDDDKEDDDKEDEAEKEEL